MSNLIKSVYFNFDSSKKRMIDSDEKVEEFIPDIFEKSKPQNDFLPLETQEYSETESGFEDGLSVIHMDDVVSQEREKVEQKLLEQKQEMLAEAQKQADALIADAKSQVEAIKEAAHEEGVQLGAEQGRDMAKQELEEKRQELEQEYNRRLEELQEQEKNLEPAFADIIISLVRKLTGVVCENKRDVILFLIGSAMKNLEHTKTIVLRVSKADLGRVSEKRGTFQAIAKGVSEFEIVEDDSLTENQCIIETDNKVIDCSLDTQLQNLEEHIKMLLF